MRPLSLSTVALASLLSIASASDKSSYTLFNPVPAAEMRDLDTDRPDKTNSAITLDAGHIQIESDLMNYTREGHGAGKQETWLWGNTNFRIGLCNRTDLQIAVPFVMNDGSTTGIGDMTVALKANFWGNDGGDSAAGIYAALSTPTGAHSLSADTVQALISAIYQRSVGSFDAAVNSGVAIAANDDGSSHHTEIVNSISIGHSLLGPASCYVEFFSSVPTSHSQDWVGTVDAGLLFAVSKNFQIDTGINVGVTDAADDIQVFLGVSWRL